MDAKNWIIGWFVQNTIMKKDEIEKHVHENYLIRGWIDSLKFILFITDIESKFKIHFANDEFQNKAFSTIDGLAKIIDDKINGKV